MAYDPRYIYIAVMSLHPDLVIGKDFELADHQDGNGPVISVWNRTDIPQPTVAQIGAVNTDALLKAQATFFARDLLAQFTPDDYTNVMKAVGSNAALGLLWSSLLVQGEAPIAISSDRFQRGWAGMTAALGATRVAAIAAAIGIDG